MSTGYVHAMLSFDLEKAENERGEFYSLLEKDGWKRYSKVTTTWSKQFSKSIASAETEIKEFLSDAVRKTKIKSYNAVIHFGTPHPKELP